MTSIGADLAVRVAGWLTEANVSADTAAAMRAAGLFEPAANYQEIARLQAMLVQRSGLLGLGGIWAGQQAVNRHFIQGFGTPAQRTAWRGRIVAVAISEPGAGAHPKRLTASAAPDGDGFRLNGEKAWVSNGPSADAFIVLAITAMEGERKRYGAFLVPRDTPGLALKPVPRFHALRPSLHCSLVLQDVRVPREVLLGPTGAAYETMALPFRDVEDAVGTFGLLGALRFLAATAGHGADDDPATALARGGMVAQLAVFEDAAEAVVAALDAGRLADKAATLVGLRLLAADLAQRLRAQLGPVPDPAAEEALRDIDVSLSVASGPRQARQMRLAAAAA
jgi:acyl-CoA dehydrogenase